MNTLERLQDAEGLDALAMLFGFTPRGLSYVLYRLPEEQKYTSFEIPKKTGGAREIHAPTSRLSLLQKRLAELLYRCISELQEKKPNYLRASHGFQMKKSIVSNAEIHRRRRFVFNLDLEDFFGAINFGRVRGFFIHDHSFNLKPAVATVMAQIACHANSLPQGSPCSPVISNLIGNILDVRLLSLARHSRCTFSRYADDLTFSTNERLFPVDIATNKFGDKWCVGRKLRMEIERAGFKVNDRKTRMSLQRSRQTVTGLVVNSKPNIRCDYYRSVRSMCNSVFQNGEYFHPSTDEGQTIGELNVLEGMLSHIYFVKTRRDRSHVTNKFAIKAGEFTPPRAPIDLYRKFLFYKSFVALDAPIIVTEGISDIVYLKCAIRSRAKWHPNLIKFDGEHATILVNFLKPTGTKRDVLKLGHGSAGQAGLIDLYTSSLKGYRHKPMEHPVIILCDNDEGAKKIFKSAKSISGDTVSLETTKSFHHIIENLYLIKVPEGTPPVMREIEDLFPPQILAEKIDGKPFCRKKNHGDERAYGKVIFGEKVVRGKAGDIDFSGFTELLNRIENCIAHYAASRTANSTVNNLDAAS